MDLDLERYPCPRILSWAGQSETDGFGHGFGFGISVQTRSIAILNWDAFVEYRESEEPKKRSEKLEKCCEIGILP